MTDKYSLHETITWSKQRLDEVDTIITQAQDSIASLQASAREKAIVALERLQEARRKAGERYADLTALAASAKRNLEKSVKEVDADWIEVESAIQAFIAATKEQASIERNIIVARIEAQRKSWETSFTSLRNQTSAAVEKAREDFDAALRQLSAEAEKLQGKIGKASTAGDESWKAIKTGLEEINAVHEKTNKKIAEAISKIFS